MTDLDRDELPRTTDIARKALAKMIELEAPFTPEAYHVWFEYVRGRNRELVAEVDWRIASGQRFTKEITEGICKRFCLEDAGLDAARDIRKELESILETVLDEVTSASAATLDYREKLDHYREELTGPKDLSEVQRLLSGMVQDTDGMAQLNVGLQEKLAEASGRTQQLAKKLERAEKEALVDPLTELYNRRAFDREAERLFRRYKEEGVGFSLVVSDIDNFKKFNDEFGHLVGDDVLRIVGQMLKHSVKKTDFASRYGGEEFFVLLPETGLDTARAVAERIRARLAEKEFIVARTGERVGRITVSLGVSATRPGDTVESLIERADKCLFLAKQSGGNAVRSEGENAAGAGPERSDSAQPAKPS